MNNKKYVEAVNSGNFPTDIAVPLDNPFKDHRGIIQNLWLGNSGSITFIESKQGAVRAKHIHKNNDWHATYVIDGAILYVEIENGNRKEFNFKTGEIFYTKPEVYHEMHFLTDTKMITINGILKNHENYEKSIIRK